jgi:hypothetical protein
LAQFWHRNDRIFDIAGEFPAIFFTIFQIGFAPVGNTCNFSKDILERDALHLACMSGVSGNGEAMKKRVPANPWRNWIRIIYDKPLMSKRRRLSYHKLKPSAVTNQP